MATPVKIRDFTVINDRERVVPKSSPRLALTTPRRHHLTRETDITEGFSDAVFREQSTPASSIPRFAEQLLSPSIWSKTATLGRRQTLEDLTLPEGSLGADYYDPADGNLYRGSSTRPAELATPPRPAAESALSDSSDSDRSSLSGLDLGRRFTRAVGDALRRRGSSSSDSSTATASSIATDKTGNTRARKRSRPRRPRGMSLGVQRSRTGSVASTGKAEGSKRLVIPVHREFTLLMPMEIAEEVHATTQAKRRIQGQAEQTVLPSEPRLLTTPVVSTITSAIRQIRQRAGNLGTPPSEPTPPPCPGSEQPRHKKARRGKRSRVDALRAEMNAGNGSGPGSFVRPLSASDLLGLEPQSHLLPHVHIPKKRHPREFSLPPRPLASPSVVKGDPMADGASSGPGAGPAAKPADSAKQGCWWLDVSCPAWEDLRDLGEVGTPSQHLFSSADHRLQLLHLHPLTLEDVLQREPREKIDIYDGLGYYFIVFRAIDETYFRYTAPVLGMDGKHGGVDPTFASWSLRMYSRAKARLRKPPGDIDFDDSDGRGNVKGKVEIIEDRPGQEGLEGVGVGGINVYLVVFPDGVISVSLSAGCHPSCGTYWAFLLQFHFDDISKHVSRVRDRILSYKQDVTSSDWIAHGLLDSIVDAFFPLVGYIDEEVDVIDSLVADPAVDPRRSPQLPTEAQRLAAQYLAEMPKDEEHIEMQDKKIGLYGSPESSSRGSSSDLKREKAAAMQQALAAPFKPARRWYRRQGMAFQHKWHRVSLLMRTSSPAFYTGYALRRAGAFFGIYGRKRRLRDMPEPVFDRSQMLRKMTEMRRLVNGLTRLLGFKHQVVSRLKKRAGNEGGEVGAYIGDVHGE